MQATNEITGTEVHSEPVELGEALFAALQSFPALRLISSEQLACLSDAEWVMVPQDAVIRVELETVPSYWALLEGEVSLAKIGPSASTVLETRHAGDTFGEVPLLWGRLTTPSELRALSEARLLRITQRAFWQLMSVVPAFREIVQADFKRRYELYQAMALHREKLISLGTLAAGLMHELNNPGAAARRAAAQLRENISRLQTISLRMTNTPFNEEQRRCLSELQEQVLRAREQQELSSLEQSDREETLSEWLEEAGVENAWRMAPTFVSMGWHRDDIACARSLFPAGIFSDALNYLDALITSIQHVGTVEESITRVTDLVSAVKKYAYDDKNRDQMVNVQSSLLSSLTILGHKIRHKSIHVERELSSAETPIVCTGAGLSQVWTNLLDNAIDATPEGGRIDVRLWLEEQSVYVSIHDSGAGIPREHWEHIFEPFYTTKDVGVGTGLGLDIAHRIVVGSFHGDIRFTSSTEGTEFIVRLPMNAGGAQPAGACTFAPGPPGEVGTHPAQEAAGARNGS